MKRRDDRNRMLKRAGVRPVLTLQVPLEFDRDDVEGIGAWLSLQIRRSRRATRRGPKRAWRHKVIHEGPPLVIQVFPPPRFPLVQDLRGWLSASQE